MENISRSTILLHLAAAFLCLVIPVTLALADSVDMTEDVPATAAEKQFIDRVVDHVKAAAPAPGGWSRDVGVTASGNTVREGKPVMIYERSRNFPLKINLQLDFNKVTAAQEKRASDEMSAQQLQQEMMNAAMSGDTKKTQQLQQQLAAMMQAQMTAGPMGQAVGVTPVASAEKPLLFHVQVVVNGEGESIGREYDHDVPGVTKAFRVDKGGESFVSYKYYLGAWQVSDLDRKNWRIVSPEEGPDAQNHLKALVISVSVYGDRDSVENYVQNLLELDMIKRLLG